MKRDVPSAFLAVTIMATQVLGPTVLWAAEQRGIRIEANRQIIVSALSGNQLTADTKALQFREAVAEGATLTTGTGTTAELLIGNRAVVAMGNGTTAQVRTVSTDQTTIQVTNGTVRVAAAASAIGSQGLVTVQTPTSQVQTRGGILRVTVDAVASKTEHAPTGAQAYRASYSSGLLVAAVTPPSDIIYVEEGIAEIPGVGPTGGLLTLKAGQRVAIQAGRGGSLAEVVNPGAVTTGILATTGHTQTPKEGRDYLVALQVDQATKLGQALTGAAETEQKDLEKKSDTKNVINGATGGVTLQNNLVNALFGTGSAANPLGSRPQDVTGAGYGYHQNNCCGLFLSTAKNAIRVNGDNALLVFTRADLLKEPEFQDGVSLKVSPDTPAKSSFMVAKELVLIGGSTNQGHGGVAPSDTLLVRGNIGSNVAIDPLDLVDVTGTPGSDVTRNANSILLVQKESKAEVISTGDDSSSAIFYKGGTLGQFSSDPNARSSEDSLALHDKAEGQGPVISFVNGAITATGANVRLNGGVALDQGTITTIGATATTDTYFKGLTTNLGRTFDGSLLSVIKGPNNTPTVLTMQDRMLGVYDGSEIKTEGGNKALLSVLDAKLKGPGSSIPLIDIATGSHITRAYVLDKDRNVVLLDKEGNVVTTDIKGDVFPKLNDISTPGSSPNVVVTSAIVTRSTLPLDGALLEASAPLFALTKANMTTTSHFADLAGNRAQSVNLGDALVALNASKLVINSGHLLNLNNATAAISGYLFSLTNNSQLDIKNGALFSLSNGSSLTLNANAFGVFGTGTNTLTIDNNLCGAGAACGALVNSANQPLSLNGVPLRVAGVTENVVVPNNFNVFAGNAATTTVKIDANDALFHISPNSTLTIRGTKVH